MSHKDPSQFGLGALPVPPVTIGARVLLQGTHPNAGRTGTVDREETTPFGQQHVVRMDGGGEVFIMDASQARVLG